MVELRTCKVCNITKTINDFAKNGNTIRYTCKSCCSKINLQKCHITLAYIQTLKRECQICGYNKDKSALEFHHLNENEKNFNIGSFASRRIWSKKTKTLIDDEIKKCICICANCHREIHSKEVSQKEISNIDFSFKEINKSKLAKQNYIYKPKRKFTKEDIVKIRSLANSISHRKLAKMFNCHHKTIFNIIHNNTYIDI